MWTLAKRLVLFKQIDLYFVTCRELSKGRKNQEVVESALKGGVKIIQYREKNLTLSQKSKEAKILRKLTKEYQALFIINDHLELALECEADGVHLGQSDMPLIEAKKKKRADDHWNFLSQFRTSKIGRKTRSYLYQFRSHLSD